MRLHRRSAKTRLEAGLGLLARRMRQEGLDAEFAGGVLVLRGQQGTLRLDASTCQERGLDPWRLARAFGLEAMAEERLAG